MRYQLSSGNRLGALSLQILLFGVTRLFLHFEYREYVVDPVSESVLIVLVDVD